MGTVNLKKLEKKSIEKKEGRTNFISTPSKLDLAKQDVKRCRYIAVT